MAVITGNPVYSADDLAAALGSTPEEIEAFASREGLEDGLLTDDDIHHLH